MKLASLGFLNNESIPPRFTCDGDDINPPLIISGVPKAAKSLVLIIDDPDAAGGTWTHWMLWNIPPETKEIDEGMVPLGAVEGVTSSGKTGYGGPCPPSGSHHYFFKLYALDTLLDLPADSSVNTLEKTMESHVLEKTVLTGTYSRAE